MRTQKAFWTLTLIGTLALSSVAPAHARPGDPAGKPDVREHRPPQEPVASDGSEVPFVNYAASEAGTEGFEGSSLDTLAEGRVDDGRAEFPAFNETADEIWKLLELPPATGGPGIESIIGADTRSRVSPTTTFPARAVALITFNGGRCTGWLYGPNIVATAGHCVHSGGSGGSWRTNVRVYPGRNGSSSPYGSCSARTLYTVSGWTSSSDERYDYGAIKLNCSIGNTTGWFGYWWQSASLTGLPTVVNGYPGDKPLEQWRSTDSVRVTQTQQEFYANDSTPGMSGGPVYYARPYGSAFCSGQCAMAIHAYGLHGAYPHSSFNHGTRITQGVFNNLQAWKNAP